MKTVWQPYTFWHCEVCVCLFPQKTYPWHIFTEETAHLFLHVFKEYGCKKPQYITKGIVVYCQLSTCYTSMTDGWRERGRASSCLKIATCLRCLNWSLDVVNLWYMYIIIDLWLYLCIYLWLYINMALCLYVFIYLCLYCIFVSYFQPHFLFVYGMIIVTPTFFVCKGMAAIADGKHHDKAVIPAIILWKPSTIMNNWVFHKIFAGITCLTAIGGCHLNST